jgi:pimeloyl-ACP methyl ester carboxylesterase
MSNAKSFVPHRSTVLCRSAAFATLLTATLVAARAQAQSPLTTCDSAGIGSVTLIADGPPVQILSVSTGTAGSGGAAVPYCLVKVKIPAAINIWVGLPMAGKWNGRLQSEGGGGYAGSVGVPTNSILGGYVGIQTDTGHVGGRPGLPIPPLDGSFGMLAPGVPNTSLQIDFAYRSEHLMAVIGKQLTNAFYGRQPAYSYWNGCSTGGRQGLMMAQRYPDDYDGILAGAPAIHWDRFQAGQIWYQMVMFLDNGGPVPLVKEQLATSAAVAACDALDGVVDGVITDPRECEFDAKALLCAPGVNNNSCLTATEASAINKMWKGPVSCSEGYPDANCPARDHATRTLNGRGNKRLWYANTRGTDLSGLGGLTPFPIATEQPKYWVYFDPNWDFHVLNYDNYLQFFKDTVKAVGPVMATDNPDLGPFRDRGGKLVLWHGFADQLIVPEGTIDYYDAVVRELGGGYERTQQFARLFMAPGVGHCGGGAGPQPQGQFDAVVNWVEHDIAPDTITASKALGAGLTQTRPLCPYPAFAHWTGIGSTDDAANFVCKQTDP